MILILESKITSRTKLELNFCFDGQSNARCWISMTVTKAVFLNKGHSWLRSNFIFFTRLPTLAQRVNVDWLRQSRLDFKAGLNIETLDWFMIWQPLKSGNALTGTNLHRRPLISTWWLPSVMCQDFGVDYVFINEVKYAIGTKLFDDLR